MDCFCRTVLYIHEGMMFSFMSVIGVFFGQLNLQQTSLKKFEIRLSYFYLLVIIAKLPIFHFISS